MDIGKIEYYRNGVGLGEAFSNIERGPGVALFPAASLAVNETIVANFGGSPFRHPVAGYNPLQEKPDVLLAQADFLLQNLVNLSRLMSSAKTSTHSKQDGRQPSNTAVYMIIANLLIEKLAVMLLNSYVIEEKVLSYVQSMCVLRWALSVRKIFYELEGNSSLFQKRHRYKQCNLSRSTEQYAVYLSHTAVDVFERFSQTIHSEIRRLSVEFVSWNSSRFGICEAEESHRHTQMSVQSHENKKIFTRI